MKDTTELNKIDDEPRGAEPSANRKDGRRQKCNENAKVTMKRILQESLRLPKREQPPAGRY